MGLRGIGAKPLKSRGKPDKPLRKTLPWQRKGLSRPERVIAFCEDFKITSGKLAGKKVRLRDWQKDDIHAIYSEDDTGLRPVRTAILSMGRKNGKTQIAALLSLCHLSGPEAEPRGEAYSCANDRAQAGKLFQEMVALIQGHAELSEKLNIIRFQKTIEDMENGSIFVALSADATTKMGLSPSFVCYDEFGSTKKRNLYDAMDTAMGARENPLMLIISTQAAEDHAPLSVMIDYGLKVLSGDVIDPTFYLSLYTAHEDLDPWSIEAWEAANPALGDFRSLPDVERQAGQAQRMPSRQNAFENLILNRRVAAHDRFINKREWDACPHMRPLESLTGQECYGALDIGGSRDLTALTLIFPDGLYADSYTVFFMPEGNLSARSEADRVPYDVWADAGHVEKIPGNTIDPHYLAIQIAEFTGLYDLRALAYDRWRVDDLKRELEAIGCDLDLIKFGQGFQDMSPAVDLVERYIAEGLLRHNRNPVMNMCAANAVVTADAAGNRKLNKAAPTGRIDGTVSLAMALQLASRYETDDALPAFLTG